MQPLEGWAERPDSLATMEGAGTVVSSVYQLWNAPAHPFFGEMHHWLVLRAESAPKLGPLGLSIGMLAQEAGQLEPGAETIVHGLMKVIFT